MDTIDHHLSKDVKVACYADDIAVWHTHTNLENSQTALNACLHGIEKWSKELKLTINPDKTNFCIFSTDRKNRSSFHPIIKLFGSDLNQTSNPKYLGLTLDAELRFSQHLYNISNKALKRLNILKRLCGASWGSNPNTLLRTYTSIIRPILEYAAPIWAPAKSTAKEKVDLIQYRASKIITGAVSSTNNLKAEKECGLTPLENRRKLSTVKFTNTIKSLPENHISSRIFKEFNVKSRLNRSSTLQQDQEIRNNINLKHESLEIIKEPSHTMYLNPRTVVNLNLLRPCTKKEPISFIKEKGDHTIKVLTAHTQNLVIAYTDGSSDSSLDRGGAGVYITGPDAELESHKIPVGKIASNYTCELVAIKSALQIFLSKSLYRSSGIVIFSDSKSALQAIKKGKSQISHEIIKSINEIIAAERSCTLQWIPAHVNIFGNEKADVLAKDSRFLPQLSNLTTLIDANAVASRRLITTANFKYSVPALNCNRTIASIITRLRTKHLKGMKIAPDGRRSYSYYCPNCPDLQLSPQHIFSCPAIQAKLLKIDLEDPNMLILSEKAVEIAEAVFDSFGVI